VAERHVREFVEYLESNTAALTASLQHRHGSSERSEPAFTSFRGEWMFRVREAANPFAARRPYFLHLPVT
jgi:hypothetical protein